MSKTDSTSTPTTPAVAPVHKAPVKIVRGFAGGFASAGAAGGMAVGWGHATLDANGAERPSIGVDV